MVRSGLLLSFSGPAALLTILILPSVRDGADRLVQPKAPAVETSAPLIAPGLGHVEPAALTIRPVPGQPLHVATMPRPAESRQGPANVGPSASEKEPLKPRRFTREGCEAPLSSLVSPEARRMLPGRCMT